MALRAKKPADIPKRLKMLLFGPPGIGKTCAGIQMPRPYIIDCERGTDHYADSINESGGVVFHAVTMKEVIKEMKSLRSETHDFITLLIDPITLIFSDLVDEGETRVGTSMGAHYGYAGKVMKRLANLINSLDMNVIMTAHGKPVYGESMKIVGQTFDGWKRLPYLFDLTLELYKHEGTRMGRVHKTRLKGFPEGASFPWSYNEVAHRYDSDELERKAEVVAMPSQDQLDAFSGLLAKLNDQEKERLGIDKVLASVEDISDLPADRLKKGTKIIREYIGKK